MKRKIILIDEDKCNGCGQCVTACAEGALQLVNGKAKLVKDQFCDGLGACMGDCPVGALQIVEREAAEFDAAAVAQHVQALKTPAHPPAGCPGSQMRMAAPAAAIRPVSTPAGCGQVIRSELQQWPVQLHLVPPGAPFFKGKELVLLSTCSPVASADVHWRFIRGRAVLVACPKLDRTEGYVEKLAAILRDVSIPKLIVVRMEVPCCGGLTYMAREAVAQSGRTDLKLEEVTVALNGDIM